MNPRKEIIDYYEHLFHILDDKAVDAIIHTGRCCGKRIWVNEWLKKYGWKEND